MTNLFFYQCKSRVNPCLKYLCVLCALGGNKQKMSNEPNFAKRPVLRSSPLAKKEPNLQKTINEQRTMNNEQIQTNPIYAVFSPKTMITKINEPNPNPILHAILSIYAIACALGVKYLGVLCALCGFEQKMQKEPNYRPINPKIHL